jgi:hypothetical protein
MKHAVSYHDYLRVGALARQNSENYRSNYFRAIDNLITNWTKTLGHDKVCVLNFILSRTLKYGKAVAAIPFRAFLEGVSSEKYERSITSGLCMSKNTLRKVLDELQDDGFLHVFYPEVPPGKIDTYTRFFEIDFKKLLGLKPLRQIGSEVMAILRIPKKANSAPATRAPEGDGPPVAPPPPRLAQPRRMLRAEATQAPARLPDLGDLNMEHIQIPNGICTAAPAGRGLDREDPQRTPVMAALYAKLDAISAASRARRSAAIAASKAGHPSAVTQQQLQAMLDAAMAQFYPALPRLHVTGKGYGALKNHLKRAAPADLAAFVHWTIGAWSDLAQRHAKGAMRAEAHGGKPQQPLPYAPDFTTFGCRLPYFLKCYASNVAEVARMGTFEQRDHAAIAKARAAAEHAKQENAALRQQLRRQREAATRQAAPHPAPTPMPATPAMPALADDAPLPEWDPAKAAARRARRG